MVLLAGCTLGGVRSGITATLQAEDATGQSGTAVLSNASGGLIVIISLQPGETGPEPASIHAGTCAAIGRSLYPLAEVVNGSSTTSGVDTTLAALGGRPTVVVIERSPRTSVPVACGPIH